MLNRTSHHTRLAGNIRVLALPFSTTIPDCVVPHTFVQPIDCRMSPIHVQVTRIGYQEPPGGGKVCPQQPCAAWYQFLVASWEVNLQHASENHQPAENLPLTSPLRREQIFGWTGNPTFGTSPPRGTLPTRTQVVTGGLLHRQEATRNN